MGKVAERGDDRGAGCPPTRPREARSEYRRHRRVSAEDLVSLMLESAQGVATAASAEVASSTVSGSATVAGRATRRISSKSESVSVSARSHHRASVKSSVSRVSAPVRRRTFNSYSYHGGNASGNAGSTTRTPRRRGAGSHASHAGAPSASTNGPDAASRRTSAAVLASTHSLSSASAGSRFSSTSSLGLESFTDRFGVQTLEIKSAFAALESAMSELLAWKDDLMEHNLPTSTLLALAVSISSVLRAKTELFLPLSDFLDSVAYFSAPWDQRERDYRSLQSEVDNLSKQRDLARKRMNQQDVRLKTARSDIRTFRWRCLLIRAIAKVREHRRDTVTRAHLIQLKLQHARELRMLGADDGLGALRQFGRHSSMRNMQRAASTETLKRSASQLRPTIVTLGAASESPGVWRTSPRGNQSHSQQPLSPTSHSRQTSPTASAGSRRAMSRSPSQKRHQQQHQAGLSVSGVRAATPETPQQQQQQQLGAASSSSSLLKRSTSEAVLPTRATRSISQGAARLVRQASLRQVIRGDVPVDAINIGVSANSPANISMSESMKRLFRVASDLTDRVAAMKEARTESSSNPAAPIMSPLMSPASPSSPRARPGKLVTPARAHPSLATSPRSGTQSLSSLVHARNVAGRIKKTRAVKKHEQQQNLAGSLSPRASAGAGLEQGTSLASSFRLESAIMLTSSASVPVLSPRTPATPDAAGATTPPIATSSPSAASPQAASPAHTNGTDPADTAEMPDQTAGMLLGAHSGELRRASAVTREATAKAEAVLKSTLALSGMNVTESQADLVRTLTMEPDYDSPHSQGNDDGTGDSNDVAAPGISAGNDGDAAMEIEARKLVRSFKNRMMRGGLDTTMLASPSGGVPALEVNVDGGAGNIDYQAILQQHHLDMAQVHLGVSSSDGNGTDGNGNDTDGNGTDDDGAGSRSNLSAQESIINQLYHKQVAEMARNGVDGVEATRPSDSVSRLQHDVLRRQVSAAAKPDGNAGKATRPRALAARGGGKATGAVAGVAEIDRMLASSGASFVSRGSDDDDDDEEGEGDNGINIHDSDDCKDADDSDGGGSESQDSDDDAPGSDLGNQLRLKLKRRPLMAATASTASLVTLTSQTPRDDASDTHLGMSSRSRRRSTLTDMLNYTPDSAIASAAGPGEASILAHLEAFHRSLANDTEMHTGTAPAVSPSVSPRAGEAPPLRPTRSKPLMLKSAFVPSLPAKRPVGLQRSGTGSTRDLLARAKAETIHRVTQSAAPTHGTQQQKREYAAGSWSTRAAPRAAPPTPTSAPTMNLFDRRASGPQGPHRRPI